MPISSLSPSTPSLVLQANQPVKKQDIQEQRPAPPISPVATNTDGDHDDKKGRIDVYA